MTQMQVLLVEVGARVKSTISEVLIAKPCVCISWSFRHKSKYCGLKWVGPHPPIDGGGQQSGIAQLQPGDRPTKKHPCHSSTHIA
jgi:hypothetical protein